MTKQAVRQSIKSPGSWLYRLGLRHHASSKTIAPVGTTILLIVTAGISGVWCLRNRLHCFTSKRLEDDSALEHVQPIAHP